MQIEIEFWGITARLAGVSKRQLSLPDTATVADAVAALDPSAELARELKRCAFALGDEMVTIEQNLQNGALLAVLPPVSGG